MKSNAPGPGPGGQLNNTVSPTGEFELHCPICEYNLAGLPESRCPECGQPFDLEEEIRRSHDRLTILFEKARTRRKIPAFAATWVTVLVLPWIFARQINRRVNSRHALVFLLVCFAAISIPHCWVSFEFWLPWLTAACACILIESLLLTGLDPQGWKCPGATLRFWLCAGCYTSAVMITEWHSGPALLGLTDLWEIIPDWGNFGLCVHAIVTGAKPPWGLLATGPRFLEPHWHQWLQIAVWIGALCCCYVYRPQPGTIRRWMLLPVLALLLLICYAFSVQYVGMPVADLID